MSGATHSLALHPAPPPPINILETMSSEMTITPRRTTLVSKNITVVGRRTSVRLEPEMWQALKDIATREHTTIHNICSLIELRKVPESSLTAAIRVFLMLYYRAASTIEGHLRAGHGSFENMKRRAKVTDSLIRGTPNN